MAIELTPRRASKRANAPLKVLGGIHGHVEIETFVQELPDGYLRLVDAQYRPYLSGLEYKPVKFREGVFWRNLQAAVTAFANSRAPAATGREPCNA